jgi:hypothetical protein
MIDSLLLEQLELVSQPGLDDAISLDQRSHLVEALPKSELVQLLLQLPQLFPLYL